MIPENAEEIAPSPATSSARTRAGSGNLRNAARPLFRSWSQISARIRKSEHILLLLDFDGTLTPLRDRPDQVVLGHAMRQTLQRLVLHPRVTPAIVSGRRRADLRKRIGVRGLQYHGLHGWENRDGMSLSRQSKELLLSAKHSLAAMLRIPGIRLEDKGMSIAMHFRKAPASSISRLRAGIRDLSQEFGSTGLHVVEGSKVLELLPPEVQGKGAAVRNLVLSYPAALHIYVGDDASDESAFAALPQGVTVRVGRIRRTAARYMLSDANEVESFLEHLEGKLSSAS
jgi:trehalose 6-phosphate phosphatase